MKARISRRPCRSSCQRAALKANPPRPALGSATRKKLVVRAAAILLSSQPSLTQWRSSIRSLQDCVRQSKQLNCCPCETRGLTTRARGNAEAASLHAYMTVSRRPPLLFLVPLRDSFFSRLNESCGLLDPRLHTLQFMSAKSYYLLSVVLQTAARHDHDPLTSARSAILATLLLQHIRELVWPTILLGNYQSVQICQACMIFATWKPASDTFGEAPTYTLFGHARESPWPSAHTVHAASTDAACFGSTCMLRSPVRIAIECGLQRSLRLPAREDTMGRLVVRDVQRCWMTCFLADRR